MTCQPAARAQDAERSRIARELHDDVSQQTALLSIDLQLLIESDPDEADMREDLARKAFQQRPDDRADGSRP